MKGQRGHLYDIGPIARLSSHRQVAASSAWAIRCREPRPRRFIPFGQGWPEAICNNTFAV
jgi:hypothetical protein